jgi:AraC-like DNA-binding protein
MKDLKYINLLLFSLFILVSGSLYANDNKKAYLQKLAAEYEKASLGVDMQKELSALDVYLAEAIRQKEINEESYARIQKIYCLYNYGEYERMYKELPEQLAFYRKTKEWNRYYSLKEIEIEALMCQNRSESALRKAKSFYDETKKEKQPIGVGTSMYTIGNIYHLTQRDSLAEGYVRSAIKNLRHKEGTVLPYCYIELSDILFNQKKYKEVVANAEDFMKVCEEYEARAKKGNLVVDYSIFWYQCYNMFAGGYIGLKQADKARFYYEKALQYKNAHSLSKAGLLIIKSELLELEGDLPGAIAANDSVIQIYEQDGSWVFMESHKARKALLLLNNHQYEESARVYRETLALKDSIDNVNTFAQLNDLRSIYELDHLQAAKEKNRLYFTLALLACSFLVVLLVIYILYSSRLKSKNRILFLQIQEKARLEKIQEESDRTAVIEADSNKPDSKEETLVAQAKLYLRTDRHYADENINRKQIADALGTNEKYLADAIRNQCDGQTVTDFINDIRLNIARNLLLDEPDFTIESIAQESGFQSRTTLFRLFQKNYGMSPSEFRSFLKDTER